MWIPNREIEDLVQQEPAILITLLSALAWIVYSLAKRRMSEERNALLKELLIDLGYSLALSLSLYFFYEILRTRAIETPVLKALPNYVGFVTLLLGCRVFVKTAKVLIFEYLFLKSMKVGVPLLLVNIFTLLLYLAFSAWIATSVFHFKIASVLAGSAIVSVILGLALQDTLGNLFSGIALQFDKPFEIGDWVEVTQGQERWVGRIEEITWRATFLRGVGDEVITVSNRVIAQSQVINYAAKERPFIRRHVIRVPHHSDPATVETAILGVLRKHPEIYKTPPPEVLLSAVTESWLEFRIIFFIENFQRQYNIADEVLREVLVVLKNAKIELAHSLLDIRGKS